MANSSNLCYNTFMSDSNNNILTDLSEFKQEGNDNPGWIKEVQIEGGPFDGICAIVVQAEDEEAADERVRDLFRAAGVVIC